jgi:hypothetical protein
MSSSIFPPPTNVGYKGMKAAVGILALAGIGTLAPGLIHEFLPDGGAGIIAGMDLGVGGQRTVALFAWAGATQIVWGIVLILIAVRYQSMVPLMLALKSCEIGLHAFNAWIFKPSATGAHPPEHYADLIAFPILLVALVMSLRKA